MSTVLITHSEGGVVCRPLEICPETQPKVFKTGLSFGGMGRGFDVPVMRLGRTRKRRRV